MTGGLRGTACFGLRGVELELLCTFCGTLQTCRRPPCSHFCLAPRVYDVWARYRLPITGRPDLAVVMQQKKMCRADASSSSKAATPPAQQQR